MNKPYGNLSEKPSSQTGPTMKKILLMKDIKKLFTDQGNFLDRSDIKVLTAATNAELLKVHREKKVDLIVTQLEAPGIKSEKVFDIIRENEELRRVSVIIICNDTLAHRERCKLCRPNAVFTIPVDLPLLFIKMQHLLDIAPRRDYRAALAVAIQGKFKDRPLPFWTENISASGMLIKAEEPLSKGDGVFFSFFLPDGTHVSGYGEITRVNRPGTEEGAYLDGIKFTNIDPDTRSAIEAVVKKAKRSSS
jgi:CheY-like chemotaxis protein